jgi:hypothetical protein
MGCGVVIRLPQHNIRSLYVKPSRSEWKNWTPCSAAETAALLSSTGERIELPNTVYKILRKVVTLMAQAKPSP